MFSTHGLSNHSNLVDLALFVDLRRNQGLTHTTCHCDFGKILARFLQEAIR